MSDGDVYDRVQHDDGTQRLLKHGFALYGECLSIGDGSGRAGFDVDFAGRPSADLADSATATQYATAHNLNLFATV